jgi:hypothetical protein
MKAKKTIIVVFITIIGILITLCGCSKNSEENTKPHINDDLGVIKFEVDNETNFNEELLKHIKFSKTIDKEYKDYLLYSNSRISEIKKFHNLDNFKIDKFELHSVSFNGGVFNFYFEQIEKKTDNYGYYNGDIITVKISQLWDYNGHKISQSEKFEIMLEQAERQDYGYLTKDNMLYWEKGGTVDAKFGDDMILHISVKLASEELNSYEYLRDLVFQARETAELIDVSKYNLDEIDISDIEKPDRVPDVTDGKPVNATAEPVAVAE